MQVKTIDAFTDTLGGGNPAGVAIVSEYPSDEEMCEIAKKVGCSETAFIKLQNDYIQIRYFTPVAEVDLCGHATIASFYGLFRWNYIEPDKMYLAKTLAGDIRVNVKKDGTVWMDMAQPKDLGGVRPELEQEFYDAFGVENDCDSSVRPRIVSTGLADILLPVKDNKQLAMLRPDMDRIAELSKKLNVIGFHVYALESRANEVAHVRNFAPLYDIPEEAATGTSNGALSYYLYKRGIIKTNETNTFIQGEKMEKVSQIYSMVLEDNNGIKIRVGGKAVIRE